MAEAYFGSAEHSKRYGEMIRAGDQAGFRRMKFGETLYNLRTLSSCGLSQGQAAKLAGITRVQWNRIENGKARPLPTTIPRLAEALHVEPAILFLLAGYRVPEEYLLFDRKRSHQRLDDAFDLCSNEAEFALYMQVLWKEYEELLMIAELGKLPQTLAISPAYAELMTCALKHLTVAERVQFAIELVESSPHKVVKNLGVDQARFYKMINDRLEELRYPVPTYDRDTPL